MTARRTLGINVTRVSRAARDPSKQSLRERQAVDHYQTHVRTTPVRRGYLWSTVPAIGRILHRDNGTPQLANWIERERQ